MRFGSFFGVLDARARGLGSEGSLETLLASRAPTASCWKTPSASPASALANLQGAESIPTYINDPQRHAYEYRASTSSSPSSTSQESVKDAADTLGAARGATRWTRRRRSCRRA